MSDIKLSDEEKARLVHIAPLSCQKGRVEIAACPMCGHLQWSCTNANQPDDVIVREDMSWCARCNDVLNRAPEVAEWVISVLQWRDRKRQIQ